jgi:O-antigen/teichoic acid export membrane protein
MASSGEPEDPDRRKHSAAALSVVPRRSGVAPHVAVTPPSDQPGRPANGQGLVRRQIEGVRRQLADPLAFNGYSLIANSGVTGVLGLVYWLLMAREYPTAAVGRASALYAAMNLLAGFTAQNLNGALTRFIPQAGLRTRTFIVRAYAVSAAASVLVSILFLATIGWWGASYSELDSPATWIAFVVSVTVWAIFTLQDSVLVGLRSAIWVLVENGIFGLVKIILLVMLVASFPHHIGIYVSWMVPAVIAVPLVNWLIFRKIVPRHTLLTRGAQPASSRQIRRFIAGDYSGALCMLATGSLIPVVVAARIDVRQTAYFYVAWVIAGIVDMIGISMGMSLTVEGAFDASALAVNCRVALRKMAAILLPCALLLALFAPFWLGLFGPAYAEHAAPILELLAAATVFRAPTELYLGALRAQSRTSLVALIQATRAVLMLGLTLVLTDALGTLGAGIAVAVSQAFVALLISVGLYRVLHGDHDRRMAATGGVTRQ